MTSGIVQRHMNLLAPDRSPRDVCEVAPKFAVSDSRIASAIAGLRFPGDVDQNLDLATRFIPPEDFARMPRLTFALYTAEDDG